tara:strand:- start:445 stop:663 length:219 start_codon:yes stop_codon:yes gene_type:complete
VQELSFSCTPSGEINMNNNFYCVSCEEKYNICEVTFINENVDEMFCIECAEKTDAYHENKAFDISEAEITGN